MRVFCIFYDVRNLRFDCSTIDQEFYLGLAESENNHFSDSEKELT